MGACASKQQADQNKATNKSKVDLTPFAGLNHYSSPLSITDSDQGPRQKWSFRGKVKLGDRSLGMVKLGCCKNDTLISNSEKQLSHLSWTVSPLQKEIELQISQIWSIQVHWSIASKKANSQGFNPAIWFCSLSQKNLMQEIWRLKQNWVKGFDAVYVCFFLMWTTTKRQAPVTVQMINLIRNQCFPCRHLASSWLLWRRSLPWGHGALATPTCTDTYP